MRLACLLLIAACGTSSPPDVVGPFTGDVRTYYVDSFTFPMTSMDAREIADDLGGDPAVDNQLGAGTAALANLGDDLTTHAPDMIAAHVISSTFEIQADDLQDDPTAGVRYIGAAGDTAVEIGGTITGGTFLSNRTATAEHLGTATGHLPIFMDADPIVVELDAMELDLVPDGTGGYLARVRGLMPATVDDLAADALAKMIAANPGDHTELIQIIDDTRNGKLDRQRIEQTPLFMSLLSPDLVRDGTKYLSFGFSVHLSATAPSGAPADLCHDRVRDGDESDVDCGGSCLACAGGQTCGSAADCQSQQCAGTCAAASCTDGVKDGPESDVDCGGWECGPCVTGHHCRIGGDCQSMVCLSSGLCQGVM